MKSNSDKKNAEKSSKKSFAKLYTKSSQKFSSSHYPYFPSPSILEKYEEICPGSMDKLLDMAKNEQIHRHQLDYYYLRTQNIISIIGQLLGFALGVAILYLVAVIAFADKIALAAILSISGFTFLGSFLILTRRMMRQNDRKIRKIKKINRTKDEEDTEE